MNKSGLIFKLVSIFLMIAFMFVFVYYAFNMDISDEPLTVDALSEPSVSGFAYFEKNTVIDLPADATFSSGYYYGSVGSSIFQFGHYSGCYQGSQVEYTLEGYEEYYTGEFKLKKIGDPDYYWGNNGGYFELYNPAGMQVVTVGDMYNDFKYDATYTPDEFKQNVLTHYQNYWQISDERMELVQFKLYLPVETVRFSIESADLNGGVATVVLNYGSVEGELVPLTLSGTYTVESGAVTLEYSTETDELATVLVENLLKSASYSYYADESTNTWVNTLTFGNKISLTHN